ncbi:MAG TPA: FAD-dependent oxidoreductase [Burkholderiales bacterium]|nr:FAD-dependent oxidoreductase [Burkholderiales bacterium]
MAEQLATTVADVIVVGGGGSGLAAASEAARLGRSVILLEKNPHTGGTTSWSVGSVTATNTPHQQRAGIQDSPQEHFEDLEKHAGKLAPRDNLALRRILVDNTTDMLEWLMRLGVVFVGPMPEEHHRYPRMHNVVPNSKSFAYHVTRYCRELGVDIRCNTRIERIVLEGGRIIGVEAQHADGSRHLYRARGGVVLAAGDYSGGSDIKQQVASADVVDVEAVNATSTGDGHRMALSLGATIVNGDIVRGPIMRFVPPLSGNFIQRLPPARPVAQAIAWSMNVLPQWILRPFLMSFLTTALGPSPELFNEGAILVNADGERFTDELARPAYAVAKQRERIAYIVFDDAIAEKFEAWPYFVSTAPGVAYAYVKDYRRNRRDIYHQADTVAGLAASMRVPADKLAATLERYNAGERGERPPLSRKPYYALGPVKSYVVFTDGGLKVSERLEVLRADGSKIDGLYAAGSTGQGGLLLEGHGHHLGWAFISGRIAGRNAAFEVPPKGVNA